MPLVAFDAGGKGPPTLQVALGLKIFHLRQSTKPLAATHAHFKKCIKNFFFFWVQWILNTTYERFIHVYLIFKNCLSRLKIVSITSFKLAIESDNSHITNLVSLA